MIRPVATDLDGTLLMPEQKWASHGIAMQNAHTILEIAHEVTLSNLKDGVAVWLEKNLLAYAVNEKDPHHWRLESTFIV